MLIKCKSLMGVALRPRSRVLIICERGSPIGDERVALGLTLKFFNFEANAGCLVRVIEVPFTADQVYFSENGEWVGLVAAMEVVFYNVLDECAIKRVRMAQFVNDLQFVPNERHALICD